MEFVFEISPQAKPMFKVAKALWDKNGIDFDRRINYVIGCLALGKTPAQTKRQGPKHGDHRNRLNLVISSIRIVLVQDIEKKRLILDDIDIPYELID